MLLKSLKVTNSRGDLLNLPLEDPSGGLVIKDIGGLGPVKATLVSSSFANMDGEQYHSSRREARNILLKLGLDPDYGVTSAHELRAQLYQFFMPKSRALLSFNVFNRFSDNILTQNLDLEIVARIESLEPDMFTKDPAVDISLMCFDPDFYVPEPVIFEGETVEDQTASIISYDGTVETGVVFKMTVSRAFDVFTIYHRAPDDQLRTVYFSYPLLVGDVLEISSIPGSKRVLLTRAGVQTSLIYALSPQSNWLELLQGDNSLRVHAVGSPIPFTLEYTTKYGGL